MSKSALKKSALIFRLSPHDRIEVVSKARRAKISVSDFCRKAVLEKQVRYIEGLPELVFELNKIGTNINQIAASANKGRDISKAIPAMQIQLSEVLYKIQNTIGGDKYSDSQTDFE
jgi:hypothetical protein